MYVRTVRNASRRHQGSRGSTARLGSLEGEKAKKMRRIMRSRGRRRSVAGGGGSGGRNGGRIRRSRERKRRSATDLAVIKELPFKPIGLGVTSNLSRWSWTLIFHYCSLSTLFVFDKCLRSFSLCLWLLLYILAIGKVEMSISIFVYTCMYSLYIFDNPTKF